MSKSENILAFEAALQESKELLEKFEAAKKRIVENKEASSDGDLLVKAAAEVGFELNIAEMERAAAESEELSDDELDNVAGGFFKDAFCAMFSNCYLVFLGSDHVEGEACHLNYECIYFEN